MKVALLTGLLVLLGAVPFASTGAERDGVAGGSQSHLPDDLLRSLAQDEARRQRIEFEMAPIKSHADLQAYMRGREPSPLDLLSAGARRHFIESLVFNENGLVGYEYSDLVMELSATDIYKVLALFGAQRTTSLLKGARVTSDLDRTIMFGRGEFSSSLRAADYEGYRCESRATCGENMHTICMSGC